ncbi:MAG: YicC/YloC family endoribonuclease [Brevundimonas sp.]
MAQLTSMTGFGRAEGALQGWTWAVEARSVNGRNLEVRFRGPPGFDGLERAAREAAQARFQRGQITLGVQARRAESDQALVLNETVLEQYAAMAERLAARGFAPASAHGLLGLRGVMEAPQEDADAETRAALDAAMTVSIGEALEALSVSRAAEGERLAPVVTGLIERIEVLVGQAEAGAAAQIDAIRERFTRRMNDLAPDAPDLADRIVLEAAALAARADVREELDRLTAHIEAARGLAEGGAVGRKLDFLMQEFMREANTLCSKSATTRLTAVGLDLKAAIEQLREQVQNVE